MSSEELDEVPCVWTLNVTIMVKGKRSSVFRKNVGDCYHNAVHWMHGNIDEIEAVINKHIDDEPKVELEDSTEIP